MAKREPSVRQPALQGKKRKGKNRRPRSAPQRTCVGCREVKPKREMIRVVRTPEGTVKIDPSGKQSGRGAYLCQQASCWDTAQKRRSLERALKTALDATTKMALSEFAQTLADQSRSSPNPGKAESQGS